MAKYHPGDFVRLASVSSVQGAVMNVYEGLTETKYQVFTYISLWTITLTRWKRRSNL